MNPCIVRVLLIAIELFKIMVPGTTIRISLPGFAESTALRSEPGPLSLVLVTLITAILYFSLFFLQDLSRFILGLVLGIFYSRKS
jgi:hypothetical protein